MKTPKPKKDKEVLSHLACSDYPDCDTKTMGCLFQFMSLKKDKDKKVKNK